MHIPPNLILPQDMVKVRDNDTGAESLWHVSDAKHAMEVEPARYELVGTEMDIAREPHVSVPAKLVDIYKALTRHE